MYSGHKNVGTLTCDCDWKDCATEGTPCAAKYMGSLGNIKARIEARRWGWQFRVRWGIRKDFCSSRCYAHSNFIGQLWYQSAIELPRFR